MHVDFHYLKSRYARYLDCYNTVADQNGHADRDDVLAEIRMRNPRWLNKGQEGKVEYSPDWSESERETAARLSRHGFNIVGQEASRKWHNRQADMLINNVSYEMKNPEENSYLTI